MRSPCLLLYVEPTPYVLALIERLRANSGSPRYEVVFVTRDASQPWGAEAGAEGSEILFAPGLPRRRGTRRLLRLARDVLAGRYAAAHLAGWGHPVLLTAIVCLKLGGVPFSMESDSQLNGRGRPLREVLKRAAYPVLFRWPCAVLPAGRRQARFFRAYHVPEEKIHVACMTVDVARIARTPSLPRAEWRARHGIAADDVLFLFVGRLERYKGLAVLLQAFDRVRRARDGCRLVVVGDGNLSASLAEPASGAAVTWAGRQPIEGVVQWMRAADSLVVPSLFEPWGLVVNEAMACGLPVVASDRVGAVDDLVQHGVNGLVVPSGDADALAGALELLRDDPGLRERMGAASARLIAPWTIEREAAVVREAVEDLCGARMSGDR